MDGKPRQETPARACVVVYAKDMAKVAEFYRQTLGASAVEQTPGFILLIGDGVEVSVVRIPERWAGKIAIETPPVIRETTPVKCSFLVHSFGAVRAAAVATGGGLGQPESAWSWRGMRHLDGYDPEGNVVQFRTTE